MNKPTLVIGNKNYSSWSLRPWLAMTQAGIPFDEKLIPFFDENWAVAIAEYSPTSKVPVLIDGDVVIWETLAILEYLYDTHPESDLWPVDIKTRAVARSIANEMHAGFTSIRTHMPMNLRKDQTGKGMGPGVDKDIERICDIWRECRRAFDSEGPFLFGHFTNVDAMFAPIVTRLKTHGVKLDQVCQAYVDTIHDLDSFKEWKDAALEETWIVGEDEI